MKVVKLKEKDIERLVKNILKESHTEGIDNYMFFQNLREIVEKKIGIYTGLYNVAKELKQEDNVRFYAESVGKLNKVLEILIAP